MNACSAHCQDTPDPVLLPPADLDAESAVLSFALLYGVKAFPELEPKHFYADANRLIYAAMLALTEAEQPIDVVAVARHLHARGDEHGTNLHRVGGSSYLAQLSDCVPASAEPNARAHAAAIIELWKLRMVLDVMAQTERKIRSGEISSVQVWEFLKDRLRMQAGRQRTERAA